MNTRLIPILLILLTGIYSQQVITTTLLNYRPNENSVPNDNVNAITDANFRKVIYILGFLPTAEQDLFVAAYKANNDSSRLFNISSYLAGARAVFGYTAQYIAQWLTNDSKSVRTGLGCIQKNFNAYGVSGMVSGTTVNTGFSSYTFNSIVYSQERANKATAEFGYTMSNILNARRRFLLTTIVNQAYYGQLDTTGAYYTSFSWNDSEASSISSAFQRFAIQVHNFYYNLSYRVVEAQQLIAASTSCAGNGNFDLNKPTVTVAQVPGSKPDATGIRPDGRSRSNWDNMNGYGLAQGGKLVRDSSGRPALAQKNNVAISIADFITKASSYTGSTSSQFGTLRNKLQTVAIPNSVYKPFPMLHTRIVNQIANSDWIRTEFNRAENGDNCLYSSNSSTNYNTYIFWCTSNACYCEGGCPSYTSGANTNIQVTFSSNALNAPSSYYIATGCINGSRFIYSDSNDSVNDAQVNFFAYNAAHLGGSVAIQNQACLAAFSSGGKLEKDQCRGPMTDDCGMAVDHSCRVSGLYNYINSRPAAPRPLPNECDPTNRSTIYNYTCASWVINNFVMGSMVLRPSGFVSWAANANNSVMNMGSYTNQRQLETVYPQYENVQYKTEYLSYSAGTVVGNQGYDPSSVFATSLNAAGTYSISDSDFTVDGCTTFASTGNTATYSNDITVAANTIAGSYLTISTLLVIALAALFF